MNAQKLKTYLGGIYRAEYVEIGGIQQWVTVRGKKMGNPILLFVHGGPGSPYSMFNPLISYWEEHFTVVQWDQRGSGRSEEHTSELQSRGHLVCRLLLETIN